MFLNGVDSLFETLKTAITYGIGEGNTISEEDYDKVYVAVKSKDIKEMSGKLNELDGVRVITADEGSSINIEFLSGSKWFAEGVQSNKTVGILFNSVSLEAICLIFYDRECDLYIVDYVDISNVPPTAIVRDVGLSLTTCIVDPIEIADKYDKCMLIQF